MLRVENTFMPRKIKIDGLCLHANATRCYNHCRYCQLVSPRPIPARFDRYEALVNRFIEWQEADSSRADFGIWPWYGNSYDSSAEVREGIVRIAHRKGQDHKVVLLGGINHRKPAEMREWLELHRQLGIDTVVASFAGHGKIHDHWNGRQGNYQFFLDSLRVAVDMGMKLQERVFLIKSTLFSLEQLYGDLDAITGAEYRRWCFQLFYSGWAKRFEHERLTRLELEALPPRIKATLRDDYPTWQSEREWMALVRAGEYAGPEAMSLFLPVSDESMDWAEQRSCDQIVSELSKSWEAAYTAAPSREELCETCGDANSDRVYLNIGQMEHVWMDRYLKTHPCNFDVAHTLYR